METNTETKKKERQCAEDCALKKKGRNIDRSVEFGVQDIVVLSNGDKYCEVTYGFRGPYGTVGERDVACSNHNLWHYLNDKHSTLRYFPGNEVMRDFINEEGAYKYYPQKKKWGTNEMEYKKKKALFNMLSKKRPGHPKGPILSSEDEDEEEDEDEDEDEEEVVVRETTRNTRSNRKAEKAPRSLSQVPKRTDKNSGKEYKGSRGKEEVRATQLRHIQIHDSDPEPDVDDTVESGGKDEEIAVVQPQPIQAQKRAPIQPQNQAPIQPQNQAPIQPQNQAPIQVPHGTIEETNQVPAVNNYMAPLESITLGTNDLLDQDELLLFMDHPEIPKAKPTDIEEDPFLGHASDDDAQERPQEGPQEENQEGTQEENQEGTQEENQEGTQEENQEGTQEENQEGTQEENQEGNQEENQEGTQEENQETAQEGDQEGAAEPLVTEHEKPNEVVVDQEMTEVNPEKEEGSKAEVNPEKEEGSKAEENEEKLEATQVVANADPVIPVTVSAPVAPAVKAAKPPRKRKQPEPVPDIILEPRKKTTTKRFGQN